MTKIIGCVVLVLLFVTGCKKKDCQPDTYIMYCKNNAKVDTTTDGGQALLRAFPADGTRLLFSYLHAHEQCLNVTDPVVETSLLFDVDPAQAHFKFYDDDLSSIHCYFSYFAEGGSLGAYMPSGGIIEGTKINNDNWEVKIDLKLKNDQTFSTSVVFTKQQ